MPSDQAVPEATVAHGPPTTIFQAEERMEDALTKLDSEIGSCLNRLGVGDIPQIENNEKRSDTTELSGVIHRIMDRRQRVLLLRDRVTQIVSELDKIKALGRPDGGQDANSSSRLR